MEKEILAELKALNSKLDLIISSLPTRENSRTRILPQNNGDQIRKQVQEQIAKARREVGLQASLKFDQFLPTQANE